MFKLLILYDFYYVRIYIRVKFEFKLGHWMGRERLLPNRPRKGKMRH